MIISNSVKTEIRRQCIIKRWSESTYQRLLSDVELLNTEDRNAYSFQRQRACFDRTGRDSGYLILRARPTSYNRIRISVSLHNGCYITLREHLDLTFRNFRFTSSITRTGIVRRRRNA